MAGCTAGCIANYLCDGSSPKMPVKGTNLAPYVRLKISGSVNITVGNESDSMNQHTAVIKSFQFGTSDGAGTTIEIFDEQGGNFERAMDKLNRCITSASRDYQMQVEFGWIDSSCGGGGGLIVQSKPFYFIPLQVEATYTEGKIRFQITGSSLLEPIFEARQSKTYPAMSLKAAITTMMAECEPKVKSVKFYRRVSKDVVVDWNFDDGGHGPDGPVIPRSSNNQNKLAVAMDWIKAYLTDKRKGVVATWNPDSAEGEVIFWEDPEPGPGESAPSCDRSIGTYIVNGGECSPVISFSPSAKWVYGALHANSGGAGGPFTSATIPNEPRPGMEQATDPCSGTQTTNPFDTSTRDSHGPQNAAQKTQEAASAHETAGRKIYPMEAELRIKGDPELAGIKKTFGCTVSLVVINPFHLSGGGCGDWLAQPGCNPVYSNKSWWIKGIDHSIKEGSYVTTLKLVLAAPGSDISPNEPFGGSGSGGWMPPTPCAT